MVNEHYTPTADDFYDLEGICSTEALVVGSYNTPHSVAGAKQYDELGAWCRRQAWGCDEFPTTIRRVREMLSSEEVRAGIADGQPDQPKMWQFLWLAAMCSQRAADVYRSAIDRERFENLDAWCLRQAQEVENDG